MGIVETPATNQTSTKPPYRRILSLDGGGIRGLIPARILQHIESRTGKLIHELFDLIAGTSTGGILATGLTSPNPLTAKQMVKIYADQGAEIFNRSLWKGVTSLGGISDERYDARPLERILSDKLGDAQLKGNGP